MLRAIEGGARETFARWVLVCADGGTALNHRTKKNKIKNTDMRSRAWRHQAAEASISTAHTHSPFQMKLMWILLFSLFFLPLLLFVWLSFFSSLLMGKWRLFGSYLDNSHIFPGPPRALEEEALVSLPLSQSGTQLCASHSAQHYLVTAAASLGLSETKSSQSQLSLLLNSLLFPVMHLLELFQHPGNPQGRKIHSNRIYFYVPRLVRGIFFSAVAAIIINS